MSPATPADPSGPGPGSRRKRIWTAWRTNLTELGAVAFAGMLLGVNIVQGYSNKRAADAANVAAQAAEDTLVASSRPWVGITAIDIERLDLLPDFPSPLGTRGRLLQAQGSFKIENFGNSPAIRVSSNGFVFVFTAGSAPPATWTNLGCPEAEATSRAAAMTTVVMPKDTIQRPVLSRVALPVDLPAPYHTWLIGCIAYMDSLHGGMHHTRILLYSDFSLGKPNSFITVDSSAD